MPRMKLLGNHRFRRICTDHWRVHWKQVEVFGRPVQFSLPGDEEHCAFQDELVRMFGLAQPKEKSLDYPSAKQELEICLPFVCQGEKLRAMGGGDVARLVRLHATASR